MTTPKSNVTLPRRDALKALAGGAAAVAAMGLGGAARAADAPVERLVKIGRIKQASCRGMYRKVPTEEFCAKIAAMGLHGIDMIGPEEWPILKKYGLICTMGRGGHSLAKGLNRKEHHAEFVAGMRKGIEAAAEGGCPNVICFSGNREGISDADGIAHCAEALKQVAALAEEKKVTLCMELLNSKVNHPDYQCDRTAWGVEVCKRVGSPRVKLLYDIYHMQIMEGDLIRTIRDNIQYIGHFHTGGNPGRNEIDETQEIYYPAVMRAIAETGFDGYVAHEFMPKRDPMTSLAQAVKICDV